jgi:hypothetical protein
MSLSALNTADVIEVMENFIEENRPPEHIRDQLDISYRIDNQSIFIFEIRPQWDNSEKISHIDIAKTTYIKSKNVWRVYWMRGNLKWYPYDPPTVKTLKKFIDLVSEDTYGCFWG